MAIQAVTINSGEQTSTGKGYKFKTSIGMVFAFDPKTSKDMLGAIGDTVNLDIEVDPPKNEGERGFTRATSFHGAADSSSAVAAAPSSAQPAAAAAGAPGGGATFQKRDEPFKKDPVGLVVGTRQTALNAAVAFLADGKNVVGYGKATASAHEVVDLAKTFNEFLLGGLGSHIVHSGVHVKHVFPWKPEAAAKENADAKAELDAKAEAARLEQGAKAAAEAAQEAAMAAQGKSDGDEIPF